MTATRSFTIGAEHPALPGHFPGMPIVPGVLLLDELLRGLEPQRAGWRIGHAKFLKPVGPGATLSLEHEPEPDAEGALHFRVLSAGALVAVGVLLSPHEAAHGD